MAEPTALGQTETIDGIVHISDQLGSNFFWRRPDPAEAIWRRPITGAAEPFYPLVDSNEARGDALAAALAASVNGDVIDLNGLRCDIQTGAGFSVNGRTGLTIRNGQIGRTGSMTYTLMFELDTCSQCELSNLIFDGEAGIQAPTNTEGYGTHVNTNPNNVGLNVSTRLVKLTGSVQTKIRNCQFRDHAGNEQTSSNYPQYYEAMAIFIDQTSKDTIVEACDFERIGYGGIADYAEGTKVLGCNFVDIQWHGIVKRGGWSLHVDNCDFGRPSFTSLGYQGAVDCNVVPASYPPCDNVTFTNCNFNFPYDVPLGGNNDGNGMFMIKFHDIRLVTVKNCNFVHGKNGATSAPGLRDSIRAVDNTSDTLVIEDCYLSGAVGMIGTDEPRSLEFLKIVNSEINASAECDHGIWCTTEKLHVENSKIYYKTKGIGSHGITQRLSKGCRILGCRFTSFDTADGFAIKGEYLKDIHEFVDWEDNVLQTGIDGPISEHGQSVTFDNYKSDTAEARLVLTKQGTSRHKQHDASLTGNYSHGPVAAVSAGDRLLEPQSHLPYTMTNSDIDVTKSNYQKRTMAGNETLGLATALTADHEGMILYIAIDRNGGNTLTIPTAWDPLNRYTAPAGDFFTLLFAIVDSDGVGTYLPELLVSPGTTGGGSTAADITNVPSGNLAATDVQAAVNELQGDIDTINGATYVNSFEGRSGAITADAGDYTAAEITNAPSGNLAATDVQAAVNELQGDIDTINGAAYVNSFEGRSGAITADAGDYTAAEITNAPSGNLAATDVQAAVNELQGDIDTINGAAYVNSFEGRSGAITADAGDYTAAEITNVPSGNLVATDVQAALNELQTELDAVGGSGTVPTMVLPTIADLWGIEKAGDNVKISNGNHILCCGYRTPGDGGGQIVRYDSGSSATIDGGSVFDGLGPVQSDIDNYQGAWDSTVDYGTGVVVSRYGQLYKAASDPAQGSDPLDGGVWAILGGTVGRFIAAEAAPNGIVDVRKFGTYGDGIVDDIDRLVAAEAHAVTHGASLLLVDEHNISTQWEIHVSLIARGGKLKYTGAANAPNFLYNCLWVDGDNTTVEGLETDGTDTVRGIWVIASNATIRNCVVKNSKACGILVSNQTGVIVEDNYVEGVIYETSSADGIYFGGCTDCKAINNRVTDYERIGIVAEADTTDSFNIQVIGNECWNGNNHDASAAEYNAGVWLENTMGGIIQNNRVWDQAGNTGQTAGRIRYIVVGIANHDPVNNETDDWLIDGNICIDPAGSGFLGVTFGGNSHANGNRRVIFKNNLIDGPNGAVFSGNVESIVVKDCTVQNGTMTSIAGYLAFDGTSGNKTNVVIDNFQTHNCTYAAPGNNVSDISFLDNFEADSVTISNCRGNGVRIFQHSNLMNTDDIGRMHVSNCRLILKRYPTHGASYPIVYGAVTTFENCDFHGSLNTLDGGTTFDGLEAPQNVFHGRGNLYVNDCRFHDVDCDTNTFDTVDYNWTFNNCHFENSNLVMSQGSTCNSRIIFNGCTAVNWITDADHGFFYGGHNTGGSMRLVFNGCHFDGTTQSPIGDLSTATVPPTTIKLQGCTWSPGTPDLVDVPAATLVNNRTQTLTVGATITYDVDGGPNAELASPGSGNTIANLSGDDLVDGMTGQLKIQGSANHPSFGANWDFGDQGSGEANEWTLTTNTSKADIVSWWVTTSGKIAARVVVGHSWS